MRDTDSPQSEQNFIMVTILEMVPEGGIEPPLPFGNRILNPARLPVPPPRHAGKYMRGKAVPPERKMFFPKCDAFDAKGI